MEYEHTCIKPTCSNKYNDSDPDAYYCPSCNEERKLIAQEINSKIVVSDPNESHSALKEYNSAQKIGGFMRVRL